MAWDPTGHRIASSSASLVNPHTADTTVRVWDAEMGREIACLPWHEGFVGSVAWDPAGKRIASGSHEGTVQVWDAGTGRELALLQGHDGWVVSVASHPDGHRLVSGSHDKTIRIWDTEAHQELLCLRGCEKWVACVAWDPEGRRLASYSGDDAIRVWNAETGECIEAVRGRGDVSAIAAGPPAFPWRALARSRETVIERADGAKEVAWLPMELQHIATRPDGLGWAGAVVNYVAILVLEVEGEPE